MAFSFFGHERKQAQNLFYNNTFLKRQKVGTFLKDNLKLLVKQIINWKIFFQKKILVGNGVKKYQKRCKQLICIDFHQPERGSIFNTQFSISNS